MQIIIENSSPGKHGFVDLKSKDNMIGGKKPQKICSMYKQWWVFSSVWGYTI